MKSIQKKIIPIILVVAIVLASVAGGIYYGVTGGVHGTPERQQTMLSNKSFVMKPQKGTEGSAVYFTFSDDGTVAYADDATYSTNKVTGVYAVYTGDDIAKLYKENKSTDGLSYSDVKTVKEAVDSMVDAKLAQDAAHVVYLQLSDLKDGSGKAIENRIFMGASDGMDGYSLEEMNTRSYYQMSIS